MTEDGIATCDLLVIGGGINGAGIAADAAGRGLSVLLCEKADLGGATSSASTKLVHGGLRYLEYYEFRLVREALAEREVMLRLAPHIVWPMRFRLPHVDGLRPRWLMRAGLFLYDHLSRRNTLPSSRGVRFDDSSPLLNRFPRGFEYSDCWVDDARLVILNAMLAAERGATVRTRTECVALEPQGDAWLATLQEKTGRSPEVVKARAVINASGPWVGDTASRLYPEAPGEQVRLVKGSHIVVPRLHPGPEAYMLQNDDQRVIFVIPYEQDFTLIGTTEVDYRGDPAQAAISDAEIDYLLEVVNRYFRSPVSRDGICHDFAGVRPLVEEGEGSSTSLSRDYRLERDDGPLPLLTIYGGKITTYRRLAENALEELRDVFPSMGDAWTAEAVLPGGDFSSQEQLLLEFAREWPWIPRELLRRWVRSYGTLSRRIVGDARGMEEFGVHFGGGLYEREVRHLMSEEWASEIDDILWRRSKLGLRLTQREKEVLKQWLDTSRQDAGHGNFR